MPLIAEFQWTREIEDRLLAPIDIRWVAIEKVVSGTIQALVAGLVVLPAAWAILGRMNLDLHTPLGFIVVTLLVAIFSAAGGLAMGCTVDQTHIGLMFSLVLTPMIFFGCTYYPWDALKVYPALQEIVLLNPMVYASEGLRGTLLPQFPHLSMLAVVIAMVVFDALLMIAGLHQFRKRALS